MVGHCSFDGTAGNSRGNSAEGSVKSEVSLQGGKKKLMKREASSTLGDTVWRYLERVLCATAVQNASRCNPNSNRGEEKDIDEKQRPRQKVRPSRSDWRLPPRDNNGG